ncbi:MAG: serine hydrolase [Clostridiales bacterium]|nr:serine hydrolase [Clostridiales bacterium]
MKNPKSNYIIDAVRIRRKRRLMRGIIAGVSLLIVGFVVFFVYILNLKEDIDESFSDESIVSPSAYSFASTETEDTSEADLNASSEKESASGSSSSSEESTGEDPTTSAQDTSSQDTETTPPDDTETVPPSGDATTEDTQETREPGDIDETNDTDETAPETTPNLQPDETMHHEPVAFPQKYPLQKVTHAERDQSFASLKQSVKKYIEEHTNARIGFYFKNLSTSEAFGFNDVQPFVVGSCIHIPMVKMLCDEARSGRMTMDRLMTYTPGDDDSKVDSKVSALPSGKKIYTYQLVDYALKYGDGVAMNMLIESMGGLDDVLSQLKKLSRGIDFTATHNYTDYTGKKQAGAYRSCAYDLANYIEDLYWDYLSYPEYYQVMIDSLYGCDSNWGVGKRFPSDTIIMHRTGSNTELHSEADVAIILSTEPVIISVTVEAETPEEAKLIQGDLGALVYKFLSYCHT